MGETLRFVLDNSTIRSMLVFDGTPTSLPVVFIGPPNKARQERQDHHATTRDVGRKDQPSAFAGGLDWKRTLLDLEFRERSLFRAS